MSCRPKAIRKAEKPLGSNQRKTYYRGYCLCCPCNRIGCESCPSGGRCKGETVRAYTRRWLQAKYPGKLEKHYRPSSKAPKGQILGAGSRVNTSFGAKNVIPCWCANSIRLTEVS